MEARRVGQVEALAHFGEKHRVPGIGVTAGLHRLHRDGVPP